MDKIYLGIFIGIIVLVSGIIGYFIKTANRLTAYENKARELDADVDVALTKRFDLLKKQYDAVKMYCSHESRTLIETIKMRNSMTVAERDEASEKMSRLSEAFKVTMEAYPQLRASENVAMLQRSCDTAEEHLQASRRLYNSGVTNYNNMCMQFPSSIVASMTGHSKMEYFKAEKHKRDDVEFS